MYLRLKIYEQKNNREESSPLFFYEATGEHVIQLMIITVLNRFVGSKISKQVETIFNNERGN